MAWEIYAVWVVAAFALILFLLSEHRRRSIFMAERARHFATAPAFRHRSPAPAAAAQPSYTPTGLSASDRMFLEAIAKNAKRTD